eukprot:127771-Chlamydomonas_euryale.AAC.1
MAHRAWMPSVRRSSSGCPQRQRPNSIVGTRLGARAQCHRRRGCAPAHQKGRERLYTRDALLVAIIYIYDSDCMLDILSSVEYVEQGTNQDSRPAKVRYLFVLPYIHHTNCDTFLPVAEFAINNASHTSTVCTKCRWCCKCQPETCRANRLAEDVQRAMGQAKLHLEAAQQRMKAAYD